MTLFIRFQYFLYQQLRPHNINFLSLATEKQLNYVIN